MVPSLGQVGSFVSELGDRVYILQKGLVRYQGSMAEFLADEQVRQAYLAV